MYFWRIVKNRGGVRPLCKKVLDKRTGMWFNKHNLIGNRRSGDNVAFSIHRESQVLRMGRKAEQQMDRRGQKEQAFALVFSDALPPLPGRQCAGTVKVADFRQARWYRG